MNKSRFITLMVIDPSGRHTRRFSIPTRSIRRLFKISVALATVALLFFLQGAFCYGDALEKLRLARENTRIKKMLADLQPQLQNDRTVLNQAERIIDQLWVKSGLGSTPRSLGIGPLDDEAGPSQSFFSAPKMSAQWTVDQFPREIERVSRQGASSQQTLGELVEYFRDAQLLLSNTPSTRPVHVAFLSSTFGRRLHPVLGAWVMHKGLDLAGQVGMEIYAPADGVVIWTGYRGGYGQTVVVDHGYGLQTHYAHLSKYKVEKGEHVHRGDLLAFMGNSGMSTGPHLHYEVRRYGRPLNPQNFILD